MLAQIRCSLTLDETAARLRKADCGRLPLPGRSRRAAQSAGPTARKQAGLQARGGSFAARSVLDVGRNQRFSECAAHAEQLGVGWGGGGGCTCWKGGWVTVGLLNSPGHVPGEWRHGRAGNRRRRDGVIALGRQAGTPCTP